MSPPSKLRDGTRLIVMILTLAIFPQPSASETSDVFAKAVLNEQAVGTTNQGNFIRVVTVLGENLRGQVIVRGVLKSCDDEKTHEYDPKAVTTNISPCFEPSPGPVHIEGVAGNAVSRDVLEKRIEAGQFTVRSSSGKTMFLTSDEVKQLLVARKLGLGNLTLTSP